MHPTEIKLAATQVPKLPSRTESPIERVERFYAAENGPLVSWLMDECARRGDTMAVMAAALGVTYGFINQLCTGIRTVHEISHYFCVACARYLGVPTIAVKIVANVVTISDFWPSNESETEAVERVIRHIQSDPVMRQALPLDLSALPFDAKKAITLMYVQSSNQDIFGLNELPAIVYWCKKAVGVHDDKTVESRN